MGSQQDEAMRSFSPLQFFLARVSSVGQPSPSFAGVSREQAPGPTALITEAVACGEPHVAQSQTERGARSSLSPSSSCPLGAPPIQASASSSAKWGPLSLLLGVVNLKMTSRGL